MNNKTKKFLNFKKRKFRCTGKCFGKKIYNTPKNEIDIITKKDKNFYTVNVKAGKFKELVNCSKIKNNKLKCLSMKRTDKHFPVIENITFKSPFLFHKIVKDMNKKNPNVCKLYCKRCSYKNKKCK